MYSHDCLFYCPIRAYLDRVMLCGPFNHVWTCAETGRTQLTFQEAQQSEQKEREKREKVEEEIGSQECALLTGGDENIPESSSKS